MRHSSGHEQIKKVNLKLWEKEQGGQKCYRTYNRSLMHLVRNAIDHGIEPTETRQKENLRRYNYIRGP